MNPGELRWFRFSLVGAVGIVVQMAALTVFVAIGLHYLLATMLAVEVAVLHNFSWHQHYTWADRSERNIWARLLRFHLSNGLISIAGNLLMMRLLVGSLKWQVLPANLASISICFVANYLASDRWVFLLQRPIAHEDERPLGER
ncbi:MAG: GtrA family protein [Terriglobales bacterium]